MSVRAAVPSGAAILLCWCLGEPWASTALALMLTRAAAAQAPVVLSPAEKERLFRQFQKGQDTPGQTTATPAKPERAPHSPPVPIQPTSRFPPARPRPPALSEPTLAEPALTMPSGPSLPALRIVIHVPPGAEVETVSARLLASLDPRRGRVEIRRVAAAPRQPSIRYFRLEDGAAARTVAAWLSGTGVDWTVRDFTAFRPLPSRGTIEVWLSEEA